MDVEQVMEVHVVFNVDLKLKMIIKTRLYIYYDLNL